MLTDTTLLWLNVSRTLDSILFRLMQYTETIAPTITIAITTGIITPIGAEDLPPVFLPLEKKLKAAKFRVSFKISG